MTSDLAAALAPLTLFFEAQSVPYYVGGSVASSAYGTPRATLDVDVVAAMDLRHAAPLVKEFHDTYYVAEERVREAVSRRSSFNLIHLATMMKVDVFVAGGRAHDREAMDRRILETLPGTDVRVYLASPEDVVLAKLDWFLRGGEVSNRQWEDVLGVLRAQSGTLDTTYLRRWAAELGLAPLLDRSLQEALPEGD